MGYKVSPDGNRVVALRELQLGQESFVRVDNGSTAMAIDGQSTGAVTVLWNGSGGGGDAGGDWITDGIGAETPGSSHLGAKGWDTGVAALNDDTRFDNGVDIDVAGTYAELTFWVQPKAFPAGAKLRVQWQDSTNTVVGANLNVSNYVANMDLDVWQKVSIPIDDFNLTAVVSKIRFRYRQAGGQQFWFDDVELLTPGGGPYRFRVEAPDAQLRYHLSMMVLVVSAPSTGWDSSAFANVTGGLDKGLIVRQRKKSTGEVLWALNSRNNVDLFGRFHPQDDITFASGEMLVGFMIKPGKASVILTEDDVLEVVVRDDLSAITEMRAYAHFGTELLT